MQTLQRAFFIFLAVSLVGSVALAQETTIGEWDDTLGTFWSQNIKIVEAEGKLYRVTTFPKERPSRAELTEVKPLSGERRRFRVNQSPDGEAYAIGANGNLRLFDSDGFIREAKRIQ